MEILASITVIDKASAKVLEVSQYVFECEDCTDFDEFTAENAREICEFLYNSLTGDYTGASVRFVVEFCEVEEEPDEDELAENELKIELLGVIKWLA